MTNNTEKKKESKMSTAKEINLWHILSGINWVIYKKDNKRWKSNFKSATKVLKEKYSIEKINEIESFIGLKVKELTIVVKRYRKEENITLKVSPSTLTKVIINIMALGRKEYNICLSDPIIVCGMVKKEIVRNNRL